MTLVEQEIVRDCPVANEVFERAQARVAVWEPAPMPDGWVPEPLPTYRPWLRVTS